MSARRNSLRKLIVASSLALILGLVPLASALAGGGGTVYPR